MSTQFWLEMEIEEHASNIGYPPDVVSEEMKRRIALRVEFQRRKLLASMAAEIAGPIMARIDGRLEELDRQGQLSSGSTGARGVGMRSVVADTAVALARDILSRLDL